MRPGGARGGAMRVTYTWTEQEWAEASRLARQADRRARGRSQPLPGTIVALIGIPLVGAVVDLVLAVRQSGQISFRDSMVPLLLGLFALTAAVLAGANYARRKRERPAAPQGESEAVLLEGGWRVRQVAVSDDTDAALRPWSELVGMRRGRRVVVLARRDGFDALPVRVLTPEQGGHLHRLVTRKLRPGV